MPRDLGIINLNSYYQNGYIVNGSFINLYTHIVNCHVVLPFMNLGDTLILSNIGALPIPIQGYDLTMFVLYPGQTYIFTLVDDHVFPYGWSYVPYDINNEAKTFIFSENPNKLSWQGTYDYNFDKMLCVRKYSNPPNNTLVSDIPTMINDIRVFGMRQLTTFRLKDFLSNLINGINVNGWVIIPISPQKGLTSELIDVLIHSDQIPIRVEFAETEDALPECFLDSSVSVLYLKNYRGSWFNQVPRKLAVAPSTSRNRMQNTQFYIKIIHNEVGQFVIRDVISGFKMLV
jgi:hypothetical protein